MYCTACGQELPDEARFCWRCGTPVSAGRSAGAAPSQDEEGWVYQDFKATFPLNATPWYSLATPRPPAYSHLPVPALRLIDRVVASLVSRMRKDGWEPAEPTGAISLWSARRVEFKLRPRGALWALATFQARYDVMLTEVTVRFRRPAPSAATAP
jgi:hypothetical protein